MAGDDFDYIVSQLSMLGISDVLQIGNVPEVLHALWPGLTSARLVITGERKVHIHSGHPEMSGLNRQLIQTLLDPEELHRNKLSKSTAIFWRKVEGDDLHYIRAAVSLATTVDRHNSLISAWQVRKRDYERITRQGRTVWKKT